MSLLSVIKQAALEAVRESQPVDILTGTVESDSPLKIRIDQKRLLDEDFLILTYAVRDYETDISIDNVRRKCTVHNALKKGEKCMILMEQGGQNYIVLCRSEG